VIEGGLILARACGPERVVIAIEDRWEVEDSPAGLPGMRSAPASASASRKVFTIYPEGGERQFIQALTGRKCRTTGCRRIWAGRPQRRHRAAAVRAP
jgi:Na+-translocating ferredoxin:NAD+ oxidoreductase subunit C